MATRDSAKSRHVGRHRAVRGAEPNGFIVQRSNESLTIVVNDPRLRKPQTLDCSAWLQLPRLLPALTSAAGQHIVRKESPLTRKDFIDSITYGFVAFLATEEKKPSSVSPRELSTALIGRLITWLGRKRDDGTFELSASTRLHQLGAVRQLIEGLRKAGAPLPEECRIPRNPWPNASRGERRTEALDLPTLRRFMQVCMREIRSIVNDVEKGWRELECARARVAKTLSDVAINSLGTCLLAIHERFDGILPERQELMRADRAVYRFVESTGYRRIFRMLHPAAADLMCFVYLFGLLTLFNAQPLLGLTLDDIVVQEVLGQKRIAFRPRKVRARRHRQHRSFPFSDDLDNPGRLYEFLDRWTAGARKHADKSIKRVLFIYVRRDHSSGPAVNVLFSTDTRRGAGFTDHALQFCTDNGFKYIGTRIIRATGTDLASTAVDGDLRALMALTGHRGTGTLERNYAKDAAKRELDETIGRVQAMQTRWVRSRGAVDPRVGIKGADHSAATPGWRCVDPLHSPIAGQVEGALCSAYGQCPACPYGQIDLESPYALARTLQLRELLVLAKSELGAPTWDARYAHVLRSVTKKWLPLFSDVRVLSKASRLHLGPLPPLE